VLCPPLLAYVAYVSEGWGGGGQKATLQPSREPRRLTSLWASTASYLLPSFRCPHAAHARVTVAEWRGEGGTPPTTHARPLMECLCLPRVCAPLPSPATRTAHKPIHLCLDYVFSSRRQNSALHTFTAPTSGNACSGRHPAMLVLRRTEYSPAHTSSRN
jgi:hypothetical protein